MNSSPLWSPQDVAERFVEALGSGDYDIAERLLAKDIVYSRSAGPAVRGRAKVARSFRRHEHSRVQFQAVLVSATAAGGVALTERVTALVYGPFRVQYGVRARFEVRDGRIAAWHDQFEVFDLVRAVGRAVAGVFYEPARARLPRPVM